VEALQRAAEVAAADIVAGMDTRVRLSYEDQGDGRWMVLARFGKGGTGVFANAGQAWPDLLATVADGLREAYIDEYWEARPRCPFHEHPLSATVDGDTAIWACPHGIWKRPIGGLTDDPEYLSSLDGPLPRG
jgi:hypothetical protein